MEFGMNLDTKDKKLAKTIAEAYSENVKSKAYLAFLGVCAFKEYLKDCDISAEKTSLARIKKIYETTDIADVFANGVCIDVRTYTSSDALYVPKKHFENMFWQFMMNKLHRLFLKDIPQLKILINQCKQQKTMLLNKQNLSLWKNWFRKYIMQK